MRKGRFTRVFTGKEKCICLEETIVLHVKSTISLNKPLKSQKNSLSSRFNSLIALDSQHPLFTFRTNKKMSYCFHRIKVKKVKLFTLLGQQRSRSCANLTFQFLQPDSLTFHWILSFTPTREVFSSTPIKSFFLEASKMILSLSSVLIPSFTT